jgi:single-stranded DNA-binding protein
MAISINQFNGAGYLTADAEVFPGDNPRGKFGVAIHGYKDSVLFMNCTAWGKQAENVCPNLKKGQPVYVTGELVQNEWDKEGVTMRSIDLNVRNIQYLSRKDDAPVDNTPQPSDNIPF